MKVINNFILAMLVILCIAVLFSCSKKEPSFMHQSVTVSIKDVPDIIETRESEIEPFEVESCGNLVLDIQGYDFEDKLESPFSVHVLNTSKNEYHRATFENFENIQLSPETLIPINNSGDFTGFEVNNQYFISIGQDNFEDEGIKDRVFKPVWGAIISVK